MAGRQIAPVAPLSEISEKSVRDELTALASKAVNYAEASRSPATRRAYATDMRIYGEWCAARGLPDLPTTAATLVVYLTAQAGACSVSTLNRRLSAIRSAHLDAGHALASSPELIRVWAGIRRTYGAAPRKKRALAVDTLRKAVRKAPTTRKGRRDTALMLLGFAGALRRSELAGLVLDGPAADRRAGRLAFVAEGIELHLGVTKTDQEARGATVAIPFGRQGTCPVTAMREWIAAEGVAPGERLFKVCDRTIARAVKRGVAAARQDPSAYGGHSLRSGLATEAARNGANVREIMSTTRHKSTAMAESYVQNAERWKNNAARKAGL